MGVKDLWNVLTPVSHKVSLYDLQDKVVAIDLSCWVCEGQCVGEKTAVTQPRMYLRTLFFRTYTLLMMNVTPIFILEGEAPAQKLEAMKQRNDARFKRYRNALDDDVENDGKSSIRQKGGRSRFRGILKQCHEMLKLMGVTCLQSDGEAEALCGQLNRDGLVDAVITQDSDVFLYGARTVYRNLTIKAGTGTVDVYEMADIETKLNLNREKLVAMSLLCGCDYDQAGVHGVGKEMAYKYLMACEGDALQRLRTLGDDRVLKRLEDERNGCSKCCHAGKVSEHKKGGCLHCGTAKGCSENRSPLCYKNMDEDEKKRVTIELNVRKKAVSDPSFPNEETISEYLHTRQELDSFDAAWKKPDICRFARFCTHMLEWELEYGFEKILPMTTRWILLKSVYLTEEELIPDEIVKKRIVKGVPCFDLSWRPSGENLPVFLSLMSDECACMSEGKCISTEPQVLVADRLPDLYATFIEKTTKKKPPKVKKSKKATKKCEGDSSAVIDALSLEVPKVKTKTSKSRARDTAARTITVILTPVTSNIMTPMSPENRNQLVYSSPHPAELERNVSFGLFDYSVINFDTPQKELSRAVSDSSFFSGVGEEKNTKVQTEQLSFKNLTLNESIVLSDDCTVEYDYDVDVSAIVDDIVSRKRFY